MKRVGTSSQQPEEKPAQNPSSTKSMALAMLNRREQLEGKRKQEEDKKKEDQDRADKQNRVSIHSLSVFVDEGHGAGGTEGPDQGRLGEEPDDVCCVFSSSSIGI